VLRFARWLREHNTALPADRRVGFFGLDVYSLWESLHAVLGHLREHDPDEVEHALAAYDCFEPYAEDPRSYALATRLVPQGCQTEVVSLLTRLRERAERSRAADGGRSAELAAWQNAEILAGAERYYRAIGVVYRPQAERWGNYVPTVLDRHYDAFLYLDRTRALDPLHRYERGTGEEETYPAGV